MEIFSNNHQDYWKQIKTELLDTVDTENCQFRYLEIGQLLTHGFSVIQTKKNPQELVFKIWNAKYDNRRFDKGIFNLARLAITDCKIKLKPYDLKQINNLLSSELKLTKWDGFVLDGLYCQFETKNKKLNWNMNEEINGNLSKLIELVNDQICLKRYRKPM
jgi:hypothetical protein